MSDSLCRLSVRSDGEHTSETTDLVLPAGATVDALLPDIVALAHPRASEGVSWRLGRAAGDPIDGSLSLRQNGVHDGDVLELLRGSISELGMPRAQVATMAAGQTPSDSTGRLVGPALVLWAMTLASVLLIWSAVCGDHVAAAAVACGGMLATLAASWRSARVEWPAAAVVLAFAAGFSAVPGGPAAPNVLLGAAMAFAVALVLLRVGAQGVSVAAAAFSVPTMAAAAAASAWSVTLTSAGVAVTVSALVVLSAAPRCAVAAAGLTPRSATVADGDGQRIELAQRVLTAMVMGAAAAAAVGTVVVAGGAVDRSGAPTVVFSWVATAAIALRAPSYRDSARRWAVLLAGMVCATAALAVTAMAFPGATAWLGGGVITAVVVARRIGRVGDTAGRYLVHLEYAALAAVPPCALWAADVFRLVRGG
ncbi:type VII secretion integral membrane protein EccD [Mycolicibacterium sp. lyk4-40-TYG-92]|uniref:type VII secretion integral membrane protein EccD n=1 Tax=Mycolicibacterium sp. lyk4-40-TYG-92 TaxID=3040295 RepID=UPI00254FCE75|nr:type VII secretion integral membrane protein EccD [Mycolicibacterium sp. lyk4-40-TYG-92]